MPIWGPDPTPIDMLKYAEHVQTMGHAERQRLEKMLGVKIDELEKLDVD
jgi:hypothetical protein